MRLRILRVTSAEHGTYHCVAKNEFDITKGSFIVDGLSYFILYYFIRDLKEPLRNLIINNDVEEDR